VCGQLGPNFEGLVQVRVTPLVSLVAISGIVLGTFVGGVLPVAGAAAAFADSPSQTPPADPAPDASTLTAQTESAAVATAASSGKMVNVLSDTTENSMTWANPDGSWTTQETGGPTRIKDTTTASGWRDLDFTLVKHADGTIGPKSGSAPLSLSPAAAASDVAKTGVVSTQNADGSTVKFGWNGSLPEPVLSGTTATYYGVEPNLNIIVTLTASGFEQYFQLTSSPTAAELNLVLPLSASGLTPKAQAAGGVDFTDSSSKVVGSIAPAFMWDARTDPLSGLPVDQAPLTLAATGKALDVTSPSSFFSDPNIQYPVTIDPSYVHAPTFDTFVRSDFPTTTYQSYDPTELQVGTYNSGTSVARSYLSFDQTAWRGTVVTGATLNLYEFHSYSCTAAALSVRSAGNASASTDWNNQPSHNNSYTDSVSNAHGYSSSCPAAAFGVNIKNIAVYSAAATTSSTMGLGLFADEANNSGWKRFNSADATSYKPSITVTYEHTPAKPTGPSFSEPLRTCGTATDPVYVNDSQDLTLESDVTDADSGVVMTDTASVYSATLSSGTWTASTTAISPSPVSVSASAVSGPVEMTLPASSLAPGGYAVAAQTQVVGYTVKAAYSAMSDLCYFVVKNTAPALPSTSIDTPTTTVGGAMTVHFSAPPTDAPAVFAYWWVPGTATTSPDVPVTGTSADVTISSPLPADGTGDGQVRYATVVPGTASSASVTVAPIDQSSTLWVAVYDAAGNESFDGVSAHSTGKQVTGLAPDPGIDYSVGHFWNLDASSSPLPSTIADTNTTSGTAPAGAIPLNLTSSTPTTVVADLGNGPLPVFSFDGTVAEAVRSTKTVADTTAPFTVSALVQPNVIPAGGEIALSQKADNGVIQGNAAYSLGISGQGNYEFCMYSKVTDPVYTHACAIGSAATAGTPAFISGVWDPRNQQLRLLVNGTAVGWAWYTLPTGEVSSTGPLLVGAEAGEGEPAEFGWNGLITNPSVYPGIVDSTEASNLVADRNHLN
jgi:hypothetical protein